MSESNLRKLDSVDLSKSIVELSIIPYIQISPSPLSPYKVLPLFVSSSSFPCMINFLGLLCFPLHTPCYRQSMRMSPFQHLPITLVPSSLFGMRSPRQSLLMIFHNAIALCILPYIKQKRYMTASYGNH